MLTVNDTDSTLVICTKLFATAAICTAASTAGVIAGFAAIGYVLDKTQIKIVPKYKNVIPE